jgi:hypothetical protein
MNYHYQQNVSLGNVKMELSTYLNAILWVNLDEINPKLWVTTSISAIIRVIDKG